MNKINMIGMALVSSALVACGGGSGSPSKPDLCSELNVANCDQVVIPSSTASSVSSVKPPVNNILPINENFAVDNATQMFTPSYKSLLSPNSQDPSPAFYYSTSGLDAGRIVAANGKMTIGNARFTLGQQYQTTGTHINPEALPADFKVNTTTEGAAANFPTTTTWGELDLTNPWKISFCVQEREALSGSASNQQFLVYVDNNQTTSSFSLHGTNSLVKQLNVANFAAGKRVEINFPGDVLVGGASIDTVLQNPGTTASFIQLRVPSAGVVTMSELWVGYQANTASEPSASTCVSGARVPGWNIAPPPDAPLAPSFEAGNGQLRVNWAAAARATTYTLAWNTVDSVEGATLIEDVVGTTATITGLQNGTSYYVFVKAINTGGVSAFGPSAAGVPEVPAVPPAVPTGLQVYSDDKRALVTWDATEGAASYSLALNTMNELTTAEVTTGITATYKRLTGLSNNTPYYVFIKAANVAGTSDYSAAQVVSPSASPYVYAANFAVTKELFFGTDGPALQTISSASEIPMHYIAAGGAGITLEEAGIRLASGGRFTIGQIVEAGASQVNTTSSDTVVNGSLNLSGNYKIYITVVTAPDNGGAFQVYLDNNTTGSANSIHAGKSRLLNKTASTIADGEVIEIDMTGENYYGTANSFIQLRVDGALGAEGILISNVRIEAADGSAGTPSSSGTASSVTSSVVGVPSSAAVSSVASSSAVVSSVASSGASSTASSTPAVSGSVVLSMDFTSLGATGMTENSDSTFDTEVDAPTVTNTANYAVKLIGKLKINTTQNPPSGADASAGVAQFSNGSSTPGKVIIKQVQCPFSMQVKHAPSSTGDDTRKLRITVDGTEVYFAGDGGFQVANVTPSCTGTVDVEAYGWDGSALGKGVRIFDLSITQ